jgi:hypothetical protein
MTAPHEFHGPAGPAGRRDRWVAGLVALVVVSFLGLAVAKPWAATSPTDPAEPTAAVATDGRLAEPPVVASPGPSATAVAPGGEVAVLAPLPVAFSTAAPPPATAPWTGLRWRRLDPVDPLSLVVSVVRWQDGFVAIGQEHSLPPSPVWTSTDGRSWEPLIFGTSSTFWPGLAVLGVAEVPGGLVALTEARDYCSGPCSASYILPLASWTSPDGRRWTPHVLPADWLPLAQGAPPLLAAGPSGLVLASAGPGSRLAVSADGVAWRLLPATAFPARFDLRSLLGGPNGYVAGGRWVEGAGAAWPAAIRSVDGQAWPWEAAPLPGSAGGTDHELAIGSLLGARDGMLAAGTTPDTPGAALWWRSADGRSWQTLSGSSPVDSLTCAALGCASFPEGLVAADGTRLVALTDGPSPSGWVSSEGSSWRRLEMTGDVPSGRPSQLTVLPGGVLVQVGGTTWFGAAISG